MIDSRAAISHRRQPANHVRVHTCGRANTRLPAYPRTHARTSMCTRTCRHSPRAHICTRMVSASSSARGRCFCCCARRSSCSPAARRSSSRRGTCYTEIGPQCSPTGRAAAFHQRRHPMLRRHPTPPICTEAERTHAPREFNNRPQRQEGGGRHKPLRSQHHARKANWGDAARHGLVRAGAKWC